MGPLCASGIALSTVVVFRGASSPFFFKQHEAAAVDLKYMFLDLQVDSLIVYRSGGSKPQL